jgi:type I restriction enzyme, S subunit
MSQQELELPQGWTRTTLKNIISQSIEKFNPLIQPNQIFIGLEHIEEKSGQIIGKGNSEETRSLKTIFHKGDVLYGKLRPYLNKICIPDFNGVCSTDILVFQKNKLIETKFLKNFLLGNNFVSFCTQNMTGTQHPRISYKKISEYEFLLPPLNEQKRIVSKIEEIFSKIDSAKQSLEQTKLQLEQYRYSYHNWIFHGNFKEKFNFSSNWEEKPLGKIFKIIGGGTPDTKKSQYWDGNIPWVTSADIHGIKNIMPRRNVSQLGIDNSATHKIPPNSILVVTRVGLGKLAITSEPICINQDIQAVIIDSNIILPLFVLNYLSQTIQIFRFRNQGTTISGVTKKQLSDIQFFLPSLDEQEKIIGHMEMAEARIQNSQNTVNSTLQKLQTMKMSVLKKAFEGKLVPQDPNDEPASVLLERIKSTKESQSTKQRGMKNVK